MLLKFWGCITRMSDLITFQLSQLARALGSVPLPQEEEGVQPRPDRPAPLHPYTNKRVPCRWVALKGYLGELFGYKLFWD